MTSIKSRLTPLLTLDVTPEQKAVIEHPLGQHARVLAVAGSGKTTTMAYRIKHLVLEADIPPSAIAVLMFNKLARTQFGKTLDELGLPPDRQPKVHTFHSFCYGIIREMLRKGCLPSTLQIWAGEKEESIRRAVHKSIKRLEDDSRIPAHSIDPDDAIEAIALWKGALIPPLDQRAGYSGSDSMPLVYAAYEELRVAEPALTYDDFVPMVLGYLQEDHSAKADWCNRFRHVIVDEYQDVNFGQQRLIEMLAGKHADVIVVGDDDQTIYEWRGARPNYILSEFERVFSNKPCRQYVLSHSFRCGPVIAQCAQNVIAFNRTRVDKKVIAHFVDRPTEVDVVGLTSPQTDANGLLALRVKEMVKKCKDPRQVIILSRLYSQLEGLEIAFLQQGIPYRVLGRQPFFDRHEIRALVDYVRLSFALSGNATPESERWLLSVANTPNRGIKREALRRAMEGAARSQSVTKEALSVLTDPADSPLSNRQRESLGSLLDILLRTEEKLADPRLKAGDLLDWLVRSIDYLNHFDAYYGEGESSEDRKRTVLGFCAYARTTGLSPRAFLSHLASLDTTCGQPDDRLLTMTTVFRAKGLQYDHVVIPSCDEGCMPYLGSTGNQIYDKAGIVEMDEPSESIENERRLFYVAITRGIRSVLIGTSSEQRASRFLHEMRLTPTNRILTAVQHLAAHVEGAENELYAAAIENGGEKPIMDSVIKDYLPMIGKEDVAARLVRATAKVVETPFVYPACITNRTAFVPSRPPKSAEPAWWEESNPPHRTTKVAERFIG